MDNWRYLPAGRDLDKLVAISAGWTLNRVDYQGDYAIIPPDADENYTTTYYGTEAEAWETLPHFSTIDEHAEILLDDLTFAAFLKEAREKKIDGLASPWAVKSLERALANGYRALVICRAYLMYKRVE